MSFLSRAETLINGADGTAFKIATVDLQAKEANAIEWLSKAIPNAVRWGDSLVDKGYQGLRNYGGTLAQRYQQGVDKAVQAGSGAVGSRVRGVGNVLGQSMPAQALKKVTDPSKLHMQILGPGRIMWPGINLLMTGLGAQQGYEVGGLGGALAGGLAGFGASRVGYYGADLWRRHIYRKLQQGMADGHLTWLNAKPGGIRNWMGNKVDDLNRWAFGAETGQGAVSKGLNSTANFFRGRHAKAWKNPVITPDGTKLVRDPNTGLPALRFGAQAGLLGTEILAGGAVAHALQNSIFNAYRRTSEAMHNRQKMREIRENTLRRMSPELRAMGYNPYRNV